MTIDVWDTSINEHTAKELGRWPMINCYWTTPKQKVIDIKHSYNMEEEISNFQDSSNTLPREGLLFQQILKLSNCIVARTIDWLATLTTYGLLSASLTLQPMKQTNQFIVAHFQRI